MKSENFTFAYLIVNYQREFQLTTGTVDVHTVNGNHITILDNDKIAQAINGDSIDDASES